ARCGRDAPSAPPLPGDARAAPLPEAHDLPPLPPLVLRNPPDLRLTAISLSTGGGGFAVLNGEIVREGSIIGKYVVESIAADTVELISASGERAILEIKHAYAPGFDVSAGSISNIEEEQPGEPPAGGFLPMPGDLALPPGIPVSEPLSE
ncbi:MAG: hypothetical protein AB1742_07910, partial [bacterium]